MTTQKRRFITDEAGNPVAVILSLEDYARVRAFLEPQSEKEKLDLMQEAANDDAFLDDLNQTMKDFEHADAEWWEPTERPISGTSFLPHLTRHKAPSRRANVRYWSSAVSRQIRFYLSSMLFL